MRRCFRPEPLFESDLGRLRRVSRRTAGRVLAVVAVPLLLVTRGCAEGKAPEMTDLRIGGRTFHLEVAQTDAERRRGLMGRASIAENRGMLFVFPTARRRSFWMKNCEVPIDVVFVDGTGRVINVHTMQPPKEGTPEGDLRRYRSRYPARFAIELRGGMAEELGLSPGEKVLHEPEELKQWAR